MRKYEGGKLVVYVVLRPTFTGFMAGVDFYNGRGSTSSLNDVARLVALGCHAEDPAVQAQVEEINKQEAKPAFGFRALGCRAEDRRPR